MEYPNGPWSAFLQPMFGTLRGTVKRAGGGRPAKCT